MVVDDGETVMATPDVTVTSPGVMTPVPPENVGVRVVELPTVIVVGDAFNIEVPGATTVTVVFVVAVVPTLLVTVR